MKLKRAHGQQQHGGIYNDLPLLGERKEEVSKAQDEEQLFPFSLLTGRGTIATSLKTSSLSLGMEEKLCHEFSDFLTS